MTIKTTRWSPDTCGCELEYSWDDSVPEDQRVHTFATYIKQCPAHQGLPTNQDRYNAVTDENPRKNISLKLSLESSALGDTQADGSKTLKSGITYNWSWSGTAPNRVLNISYSGITLTTNQKNAIQTALNAQFGANKVVLS